MHVYCAFSPFVYPKYYISELKRSSDKKRPLPDDEKKEKKKKVKKEKEKSEKASEGKGKPDDKSTGDRVNESNHNAQLIQNKQIKSEPVDLIGDEGMLLDPISCYDLYHWTSLDVFLYSYSIYYKFFIKISC